MDWALVLLILQKCKEAFAMPKMSARMREVVVTLQQAVDEELERKAKLGYKAVIADKHGRPKVVSAKYLVRKRRAQLSKKKV